MTKTLKNARTYEVYASRFSGYAEEEAVVMVELLEKMIEKGLSRGTAGQTAELIAQI